MLFNETAFLVLFLLTFFIYYLPHLRDSQVIILIISSFIFYSWDSWQLLSLLILSILINGIISFKIAWTKKNKVALAAIGVVLNLLLLAIFKYKTLFIGALANDNSSVALVNVLLSLPLPIGISFYTFEGISLLLDTFHGNSDKKEVLNTEKSLTNHLIKTSFFVAFFPHLIAGPILKAANFYPQIKPKYFSHISWNVVFRALVVGYFLKMVVADNLKDYTIWLTFPYYQGLSTMTGIILLFGYSIQIFADFAGYSLIAIGLAAALGYNLPQNFNFPYVSRSLSEFWRRWHISLSNWLKDYLYIPLGGNRKGRLRTYTNLMLVMVIGGLWHGSSWSYAVWGGYHGVGLVVERFFSDHFQIESNHLVPKWQQLIFEIIRITLVFSFVSLGWLLFRLPDFGQALDFIKTMLNNVSLPLIRPLANPVIGFSLPVIIYHLVHLPLFQNWQVNNFLQKLPSQKWEIYKDIALGVMITLILLNSGSSDEFIYFQF